MERDTEAASLDALRAEIAIGIEQADRGEIAPLDAEAVKAEGRRRMTGGFARLRRQNCGAGPCEKRESTGAV